MRFWDSSAVVPLLVVEATTQMVQARFREDPVMLVWWVTELECASALARLDRDEALTARASRLARERLHDLKGTWHEIQPVEAVRRVAQRLLRTHPLQAADSLQLAAALVAAEGDPASLEVLTLDARLVEAARREGLALTEVPVPRKP